MTTDQRYQPRDILTPLADPWDVQSQIMVLPELGGLRFHRTVNGQFETLDQPPDPATVWIRPRMRTKGYADLERTENVVARAIESKGGSLKLETVLTRIVQMGFDRPTAEGMLRYLVGRGDFVAKVSPKRKTVRLSLSAIARARESHRTFASSFAHELGMQSEQIGRLIGHGPTVGNEREELLRALIERHVPRRFHVATGFIEGSDRQLDILIYDQVDYAPLFRAGNLVVVPVEAVRALIEVKSTLTSGELADALTHLDDAMGIRTQGPPMFRGVFGYQGATAPTLIDTFVDHHRELTDYDDDGHQVFSIYDMIDAVCVLRSTILISDFFQGSWSGKTAPTPCIAELASEAGRDIQAALFFDRLLRFLRHPFEGPHHQPGYARRFAPDIENRKVVALYPDRDWGPYSINAGIERVEGQIAAYHGWLAGKSWQEPPFDED
jgi:hypothetical protein